MIRSFALSRWSRAALHAAAYVAAVCALACGEGAGPVTVDRFDASLTVLADGSLLARERFDLRSGDRESILVREFRRERHDGVFDLSAMLDGQPVATSRASRDAVRIPIPPGREVAHTVTIEYRVAGPTAVSGIRGTLAWQVLSARRSFGVSTAAVRVTLPPGAVLLQDPWVEEAGWQVARLADGLRAERSDVGPSESATVGVEFTIDMMAVAEPRWQFVEARAREFIPAYISAGLFLLVVGVGIIIMVRAQHPRLVGNPDAPGAPVPDRLQPVVMGGRPRGRGRARREVLSDLFIAGLADRQRVTVARGLRVAGLVALLAGVVGFFAVRTALSDYGVWPQAIPLTVCVDGMLMLIVAARFPILNQAGADAAARLRAGRQ